MEKISVCVIGSGKWAFALTKIVAQNVVNLEEIDNNVNMYIFDEPFAHKEPKGLIHFFRAKQKYLSYVEMPENVHAVGDAVAAARYADVIIFVLLHYVLPDVCRTLLGKIKPNALAIALIKGVFPNDDGSLQLTSHTVTKYLKIPCAVMVGANLEKVLTLKDYCEVTIGCRDAKYSKLFESIFKTHNFRVTVIDDADCVEVCAFLRNIVSFAVGLLDGLNCNSNTKSACMRFGLLEMIHFIDVFYPGCKLSTFFESCGFSDLMNVCWGSRGRRLAEAFVKINLPIDKLESEILGGEKLVGPLIAKCVSVMLKHKGLEKEFPLFTTVHKICEYILNPEEIFNCVRNIPDITYNATNTFPL